MIYVVSTLIAVFLGALETSFLPHFKLFGAAPFLMLAFLVALSFKNKGYFHIFLAFGAGLYYDYISSGLTYTFLITFISVVLITRWLLFRETSYDIMPLYIGVLSISSLVIYVFQINTLISLNFVGWQSYLLTSVSGIFLTVVSGYILYRLLAKYFDWLAKESEEKFRG